jgi:hypothetical protein
MVAEQRQVIMQRANIFSFGKLDGELFENWIGDCGSYLSRRESDHQTYDIGSVEPPSSHETFLMRRKSKL